MKKIAVSILILFLILSFSVSCKLDAATQAKTVPVKISTSNSQHEEPNPKSITNTSNASFQNISNITFEYMLVPSFSFTNSTEIINPSNGPSVCDPTKYTKEWAFETADESYWKNMKEESEDIGLASVGEWDIYVRIMGTTENKRVRLYEGNSHVFISVGNESFVIYMKESNNDITGDLQVTASVPEYLVPTDCAVFCILTNYMDNSREEIALSPEDITLEENNTYTFSAFFHDVPIGSYIVRFELRSVPNSEILGGILFSCITYPSLNELDEGGHPNFSLTGHSK